MNKDEPPTRRESGQLAVFEMTAREAITRLRLLPADDRVQELEAEARELLRVFEAWKADPPIGEERAHFIERVMDLHRNVAAAVAERRAP